MNRAERRRLDKEQQKKKATYNLSTDEIVIMKKDTAMEAIEVAFDMMIAIPMLVMHDKFGFGPSRSEKLLDEIKILYDDFKNGYLTIDDMKSTIYEELGIKLDI